MLKDYLKEEVVELKVKAKDWREAIKAGGQILEKNDLILESYTDSMIKAVEDIGPYMVIMPGIAFAHSRPGEDVLKDCLSLITLETPVNFGHAANDPVEIVFSIGATSSDNHIEFIEELADILGSDEDIDFIKNCKDKKVLLNKLIK